MVAHVCNSSTQEAEKRGLEFEASLGNLERSCLKRKQKVYLEQDMRLR